MTHKNDKIITEAKERLTQALEWESNARMKARDDYRFANGDPDNGYQWPDQMLRSRQIDRRPTLTVNKVRQHILQIVNDARQHKTAVKVDPVSSGATYDSAALMQQLIRHIEYQSQAQSVYISAADWQVTVGIGYWRVVTDYVSDDSFDQEIYLRRVKDPNMVVLDPDINERDGSDARYGFVYEDLPKDLFERKFPAYKDRAPTSALGIEVDLSVEADHIRVCEYFRRIEKKDRLYEIDGKGVKRSEIGPEIAARLDDDESVRQRDILTHAIEWYLIIGNEIAETREWPGIYIPIVRVIGEETVIDGRLDRKGHVRMLKDSQRMYNYWTSAAVEFGALQSKIPYTIPIESTEGVEEYWASANTVNHAYLPYKALSDAGAPLPPPQRQQPPVAAQAFLTGMQTAANELMMASGQYQAQMGENGNERSGIAIQERQRQGDNATYHYIDEMAAGIRYTGRILLDLIPKIYDTRRIFQITQENGDPMEIQIDPSAQQASGQNPMGATIQRILNPSIGKYEVQSDVGPAFATQRQEAFNALMQLAAASPVIMDKAPDLVMRAADFPMAKDLAERLKPVGLDPQVQQLQLQIQNMQQIIQTMTGELAEKKNLTREREQQKDIDAYRAETDRLKLAKDIAPEALLPIVQQMVKEALAMHMGPVITASQSSIQPPAGNHPSDAVPQTLPGASPGPQGPTS